MPAKPKTSKDSSLPFRHYDLSLEDQAVSLFVHRKIYSLEVLYGAAYIFEDRCYVYLDYDQEKNVVVTLKLRGPKKPDDVKGALENLVGDFANELLNQVLRVRIAKQNSKTREAIISRALFSNYKEREIFEAPISIAGPEDAFDDPLGIATPWEVKYKKTLKDDKEAAVEEQA